ncbi:MAG: hypothetical protein AAGA56_19505 [Myxococcota bacterium]
MSGCSIAAVGASTCVGTNWRTTRASVRAGILRFRVGSTAGYGGGTITEARCSYLPRTMFGVSRLALLVLGALDDVLGQLEEGTYPATVVLPARYRPHEDELVKIVERYVLERLGPLRLVYGDGLTAVREVAKRGTRGEPAIVVAGDCLLDPETLFELSRRGRLLSRERAIGYVPGEGAVALRLDDAPGAVPRLGALRTAPAEGLDRGLTELVRTCHEEAGLDGPFARAVVDTTDVRENADALGVVLLRRPACLDAGRPPLSASRTLGHLGSAAPLASIALATLDASVPSLVLGQTEEHSFAVVVSPPAESHVVT